MRAGAPLPVLDFDGVICDSIDECFASSWIAYHRLYLGRDSLPLPTRTDPAFAALRPLIRSGEDYLLIHEILADGTAAGGQEEFDALASRAGPEKMAVFKDLFYKARTGLLDTDPDLWYSLNTVYGHMRQALRAPEKTGLWILSTKKPRFIAEILGHAGLPFPEGRIVDSGSRRKLPIVSELREKEGAAQALFLDDQIDHLKGGTDPRVRPYLASWGYVKREWLDGGAGVPVLDPAGFLAIWRSEILGQG
jgi:hypothetical protein